MKVSELITVSTKYTRSINLERDYTTRVGGDTGYIITTRAADTVARIFDAIKQPSAPNAWALIGPYGAGKSAFGLFLADLLGDKTKASTKSSHRELKSHHKNHHRVLTDLIVDSRGFFPILISGNPESLSDRLLASLNEAINQLRKGKRGKSPDFINEIRSSLEKDESATMSELLSWLDDVQGYALKQGYKGLLVIVDELGKFLEYEARHRSSKDIFLLQALAEKTASNKNGRLVLVTLLHQSFEQYVVSFGKQLRDEWKKVQGRFETVPFIENSEQVIKVLGETLKSSAPLPVTESVQKSITSNFETIRDYLGYPPSANDEHIASLLTRCYPLHPAASSILPQLCQRVAQNERTLFTYLSSKEPRGFQDSIEKLDVSEKKIEWLYPHDIYDYFIQNHAGLVNDSLTQRRWAEVTTAVERLGDAPREALNLLKTIGLLNLVGAQSNIKASKQLLRFIFSTQTNKFAKHIKLLEERSVITFRKFSNEYRVWQGSDFDLESAVSTQRQQLSGMNLAELLNDRKPVAPIVARKHVIESGTLRYFQVRFAETTSELNCENEHEHFLTFCIPRTEEDKTEFIKKLKANPLPINQVIGIVSDTHRLRDALVETVAYSRVQQRHTEISTDPIVSRELRERYDAALTHERSLVGFLTQTPQNTDWFWSTKSLQIDSKRELQESLSYILNCIYSKAPRINNEIINRSRLSGAGTGARRKLLSAMLQNADAHNLGIEKSPPEKSIYLSLLYSTGIHKELADGHWGFTAPEEAPDRFHEVWREIDSLLNDGEEPITIDFLQKRLSHAPFGISYGVVPVIMLSYLLSRQNEIALSEDNHFSPFLNFEIIERILKKPQNFALQKIGQDGSHPIIFSIYRDIFDLSLSDEEDFPDENRLVTSAKMFAKFMMNLNDYAKSTKSLSKDTIAIREAFFTAKSPYRLMCLDIPKILGFSEMTSLEKTKKYSNEFKAKLSECISELRSAHHKLINGEIKRHLCKTFSEPSTLTLNELKSRLNSSRYRDLQNYTIDVQGLKAFLIRLTDTHGDEKFWIENVASFLARKPTEKWLDEDYEIAKLRLLEYSAKIRDLEKLRALEPGIDDGGNSDTSVVLIRTLSGNKESTDKIAIINPPRAKLVAPIVEAIRKQLNDLKDSELEDVALAMLLRPDEWNKDLKIVQQKSKDANTPKNKKVKK